ncbi:unnamed protein product [Didymodactylos carnosus]|uniref:Uncharacterized protein n=1 Tax=Didymodactylos carnosus TaxID=1234261 RepID=A0A815SQD2_9BILA|nr:unnamed protein product [Didymodactylos carnosus]CAF1491868.1 unnamed protein product [Didymodactylos carnosus]CAF4168863.1 unnamed protein product [Didymodactylos carnosus]CAF4354865.1 unnamed protein product [Didymodactylos carnosus]
MGSKARAAAIHHLYNSKCNINDEDDPDEPLDEVIIIHEMKSPFKMDFPTIYNEVSKTVNNYNNDKIWDNEMDNPVYCPDFLTIMLEKFMGTAPIWSNLLLSDLSRYGYKNLPNYMHCGCLIKRTTGGSESRMNYVKTVILNKKVYTRLDQVVAVLADKIVPLEISTADYHVKQKKQATKQSYQQAKEQWKRKTRPYSKKTVL